MAMDPYKKRMLQGAAQGAVTGGSTGFMLGGPVGGAVGLLAGGGAGALMARPGEDEQRYRARMRQLELGVLGPEEAAIRRQFMDPVRGAAQQQEIARRSLEQGTVTSGASARRAQAAQAGARRDIGEAAAEAEMAILDLGERRRMMADQMQDQLRREEEARDRAFRASMAEALPAAAADVGGVMAEQRLLGQDEKTLLADQAMARSARDEARRNRADLAAMSDEEKLDAYTGGLPYIDFGGLPEASEVASEVAAGTGAAAQADALEAAYRDSPYLFGEATPSAPAPERKTLTSTITDQYVPGAPPPTRIVAPEPAVFDEAMEGMGLKEVGTVTEVPLSDEEILARSIGLGESPVGAVAAAAGLPPQFAYDPAYAEVSRRYIGMTPEQRKTLVSEYGTQLGLAGGL